MADNVGITAGSGTTVAADDVGGVKYQVVKLDVGADGASAPVSSSNPVPVALYDRIAQSASITSQKGELAMGSVTTASPSYTTAQVSPLSLDTAGSLRVAIISGAGSGGTAMTDDAAFTPATTSVTPVAGTYRSVRDSVDDNDAGALAMTAKRGLYASIETPLGDSAMDEALDALKVSIVGDSVGSTTDTEDGTVAAAQATVALVIGMGYEYDATNWTRQRGGHTVAHDAVDAGNPDKLGAVAETSPKGITLVADGDRTNLYADADGLLMVKVGTSGADFISEAVSNTDGASTAFSNFTAVASTKNVVTSITAFRTDAGATMAYIDFRDGTGGSVLYRVPLPPLGGAVLPAGATPYFKTSAATALAYDVSAALSTVYISISGHQSKV